MADRIWSVLWAFCRWWIFGAVLGVVIGGGVGSAVLLPSSVVVDRIWPAWWALR